MRSILIQYGYGAPALYWTGNAWTTDVQQAHRYGKLERETLVLPRGGCWTTALDKQA